MAGVSQVKASFVRSMRIFLRDKAIFGSSILVPIFFLIVLPVILFRDVPSNFMPSVRGFLVIAMMTLLIMATAMSNLPGSIASDRDHDLYVKLSSMPVNPLYECVGRVFTVFIFSGLGCTILVGLGLILGAEFTLTWIDLLCILGIAALITILTSGIGLIIASFVKSESAAAHVGMALVLVNYFIGIAFPYGELPDVLRPVVRVNPICIGNNMISALAIGEEFVGYNPLTYIDATIMLALTGGTFILGLYLYAKYCWRR
jgi:ABC-type polysaccharide/polyol phosphate export permease